LLKLTDCLGENSETSVWLDFAFHCKYIDTEIYNKQIELNNEVGKLLSHMYNNPDKYGATSL
jgi:four helix bundle protein